MFLKIVGFHLSISSISPPHLFLYANFDTKMYLLEVAVDKVIDPINTPYLHSKYSLESNISISPRVSLQLRQIQ